MTALHFLRPWWLCSFIPLLVFAWYLFQKKPGLNAWKAVCDDHLLPYLIINHSHRKQTTPLLLVLLSIACMIIGLAGPTWSRYPVPVYQKMQPRVLVLDLSDEMTANDLSPDRLRRAKFKLHDLLQHHDVGQFGLIVYTDQAFVVSPITQDAQTIDELLSSLTPDIMPVKGSRLERALDQSKQLIVQSGTKSGQILVLTSHQPSTEAIQTADALSKEGIDTSVIPMLKDKSHLEIFGQLATAGQGILLPFSDTSKDVEKWLTYTQHESPYQIREQDDIPIWQDQGRWFIVPAVVLLLPAFRRGWLQKVNK